MIAADSISRVKLRDLISHAVNLLDLYSKMDSMYTDGLFLVSGAGNDKNESLEELGSFKNECRELVNTFFLTADSYFLKVLGLASRQFGVSLYDLKRYSILELVGLFDGTAISQEAVSGRSQSFCIASEDSVYTLIVGHSVKQLFLSLAGEPADWGPELVGTVASVGAGRTTSSVKVIKVNYSSFDSIEMQVSTMPEGAVLVAETTAPELILACRKASGIVTDMGGMLSHAAIVSRELGIPAIVGTERATLVLKDGDIVELDCARGMTGQGFVRLLKNDNSTFDRGAIVSPQGIWSGH
jgi:phosphohistidine swiveling domain-containing protein